MKKRLLCIVLGLCLTAAALTGCEKKKEEGNNTETDVTISSKDDNAKALHEHLMKTRGDYAKKYASIKDYKNLAVEVEPEEVITDETVQEQIDALVADYPILFDGVVASGDSANIDYKGSIDGELFDGGSAEGYSLVIGSGQFIAGFEEQLIGMNIGDTKTIEVTFPENYKNNEELAGKPAQFEVKVNNVTRADGTAQFDERWISAYLEQSGAMVTDASVEGFKSYIRSSLESSAKSIYEENLMYAISNEMLELLEISEDLPKEQVDFYQKMIRENVESNIEAQNVELDAYLESIQMTKDEYEEELKTIADEQMRYEYALIIVGEAEGLAPTEDEYTAYLQQYADQYSMTLEEFREAHQSEYQENLYFGCYEEKVLSKLLETAAVTDKAVSDDAAQAATGEAAE